MALGLALALVSGTAAVAANRDEGCTQAIGTLKGRLEQIGPEPDDASQWRPTKDGNGAVTAGSGGTAGPGKGGSDVEENWMGGEQGRTRARVLLRNARQMAHENKEEGCLRLVGEAQRAIGLDGRQ